MRFNPRISDGVHVCIAPRAPQLMSAFATPCVTRPSLSRSRSCALHASCPSRRPRSTPSLPCRSVHIRRTTSCTQSLASDVNTTSIKLGILVSGSGRSMDNLLSRLSTGQLSGCHAALVIASKHTATALDKTKPYDVPTRVIVPSDYADAQSFSCAVADALDQFDVGLVVMAGWMHFFQIPQRYMGRVLNIHPSLIPAFCGKGFFGQRVHKAVVEAGVKVTGCTVHIADNVYDHGPIILQRTVPVSAVDTADDVATRVFQQELEALPEAVQLFVDGRLDVRPDGIVHILPAATTAGTGM